jgi:hypothetical protein
MSEAENPYVNSDDEARRDGCTWDLPDELKAFEARLAALSPRDDRLDRERLMFAAGRASANSFGQHCGRCDRVSPEARKWRLAFCGMTAVAGTLLALLIRDPAMENMRVAQAELPEIGPRVIQNEPVRDDAESASGRQVFSARDVHRYESDRFLAAQDAAADARNDPMIDSAGIGGRPILTPADWHKILDGANRPAPSMRESSPRPQI